MSDDIILQPQAEVTTSDEPDVVVRMGGVPGPPGPPGEGVPAGGLTGQRLAKNSDVDRDTRWVPPHDVPPGGATGQALTKNSTADHDASWTTFQTATDGVEIALAGDGRTAPLSAQLTGQVYRDLVLPGNNVIVGDYFNSTGMLFSSRKLDGADQYEGAMYVMAGGAVVLRLYKNGAEVNRLRVNPDGSMVNATASGTPRPIPFAEWVGTGVVTLSSAISGVSSAVNFTAGRFTINPFIFLQMASTSLYLPYISASSATSVTVGVRHIDNVATSGTFTVYIHAIQMTPTSAAG